MRRLAMVLVSCGLVAAACGSSADVADDPPPTTEPTVSTNADEEPETEPTPSQTPSEPTPVPTARPVVALAPTPEQALEIAGPEEIVFDWTTDQCQPEHIPDIAPRAFRTPDGQVNLTIAHWSAWRMVGPSLDELESDCSATLLDSDYDPDPAAFDDSEWLAAVYTVDGETYHGIVHNEYRGDTHTAARPGQCPSGERLPCLDTSFTQVVSTDGGRTFDHVAAPPGHLVATLPYTYRDDTVPSGIRQPSNIIDGRDGYWYLFGNVSDQPAERQWICAMRTDDLTDPSAWRYWDGEAFDGVWGDPYVDPDLEPTAKCAPLAPEALGSSMNEGVVFDTSIDRFVLVGVANAPVGPDPMWGVYSATSVDLVNWSTRTFLIELPITPTISGPDDLQYAYPTLIDPDSDSLNFETSDGEMYLYMSKFNFGGNSLDRDVVRWPVRFVDLPAPAPDWTFDDGDTQGWVADNQLSTLTVVDGALTTVSAGADPWMLSPPVRIEAAPARLVARMRVSGGDGGSALGQLFWSVDGDPTFIERRSVVFTVPTDGEWHDVSVDLTGASGWSGIITSFRLDPVDATGLSVDIDRIVIAEP